MNLTAFCALVGVLTSACRAAPLAVEGGQEPVIASGITSVTSQAGPISRRFRTLDDYLAFLERTQGPVDGPWYRQVSPDVFELQTGNLRLDVPGGGKRRYTRDELEKKFGFSK